MRCAALPSLLAVGLAGTVSCSPAPNPVEAAARAAVTPSLVERDPTATYKNTRDIISDLGGDVHSILSGLGGVPSYVASGVPNFFQGFPTGGSVVSSLGLDDDQLRALPTSVLNIPPYANWTEQGWNVLFHGNVYKQPNTSVKDLNRFANIFLIGTDIDDLPTEQQENARNLTAEILVVQQRDERPVFTLEPSPSAGANGSEGGGGAVTASGGSQTVQVPYNTTVEGDFEAFVSINLNGLTPGNETEQIQRLNVHTEGTTTGNSTAYLVPPGPGLTVVSDIDDILRVTKIYDPKEGLLNSFARDFVPWPANGDSTRMTDIYRNWSSSLTLGGSQNATHFHYLTTTPEQVTRNYMQFIYANYPAGSFDTRPLNFSDVSATLSIRMYLLTRVFDTFPDRKFILVADTSNSDVMRDYPRLANDRPDQVQCILLRNTSATDSSDRFPYDTSGFKTLNQNKYMFFRTPDDLIHLDIGNGHCYNNSVPQNLTFGYQGLPFGLSTGNGQGTGNGTGNGSHGKSMAGKSQAKAALVAVVGAVVASWNLL